MQTLLHIMMAAVLALLAFGFGWLDWLAITKTDLRSHLTPRVLAGAAFIVTSQILVLAVVAAGMFV